MVSVHESIGKKFNMLTVLENLGYGGKNNKQLYVRCRCDCGNVKVIAFSNINRKQRPVKSCGCLARKLGGTQSKKHGKFGSQVYRAWVAIKDRVFNNSNPSHRFYASLGMHPEWVKSFEAFYEHVGDPPSKNHSIDRIDNAGGYYPGNLRWATRTEQARNRRSSRAVEWNGETRTVVEWAEITGLNYYTLWSRLFDHGWDVEKALTTPARRR